MAPARGGRAREVRESTGSDSETTAKKLLRDRVRAVANHRDGVRSFTGPKAERLTVGDLLAALEADYRQRGIKSLRPTLGHIKPLRQHFGDTRALAVTSDRVRAYIASRSASGVSNATINRETALLTTAFKLAIKDERLTKRPYIPELPEGKARSGFFEAHQHELMLEHLPSPLGDMARLAYVCGWRREEVRTLRWEHVDRFAREIRLPDTKNGEGRVLPLDGPTWEMFERLWAARAYTRRGTAGLSEFVFHVRGRVVSDTQFSRLWDRARAAAGPAVRGRIFHDYRRTAVRNLIRAGVPQSVAMTITGHVSDSIFRRYNITSTGDKVEALAKQREYLSGRRDDGNVTELRNSDSTRTIRSAADVE